jgi:hypothetical protein
LEVGPHFLPTDIKRNFAHQRTDVKDVPKVGAVHQCVPSSLQAAQIRKVHDGWVKSVAQVCSSHPSIVVTPKRKIICL